MENPFDQFDEVQQEPVGLASAPEPQVQNPFDKFDGEEPVKTSTLGAYGRSTAMSVIPAVGAFAGAELGQVIGAPVGAALGALVPGAGETGASEIAGAGVGTFAGGLFGSLVGSVLADKAQRALLKKIAPDTYKTLEEYQQSDLEQHPLASFAGDISGAATMFKVAPLQAAKGVASLFKISRGEAVTKIEQDAAKALAVQSGMGLGLGVVNPLFEGQVPTAGDITKSVAQMLLLGQPRLVRTPPPSPLAQFSRGSQLDIADAVKQAQQPRAPGLRPDVPEYQFGETPVIAQSEAPVEAGGTAPTASGSRAFELPKKPTQRKASQSMAVKILKARGASDETAEGVARFVGEKSPDETAEDYRTRIFAAHDQLGLVSPSEVRLPYGSSESVRVGARNDGRTGEQVEQAVKDAEAANATALESAKKKNAEIISALKQSKDASGLASASPENPVEAIWKNKDADTPVRIVGIAGFSNGKLYLKTETGTGIPIQEIEISKRKENQNAGAIPISTSVSEPEIRPPVGESPPLRQPGEVALAQEVVPQTDEAAAIAAATAKSLGMEFIAKRQIGSISIPEDLSTVPAEDRPKYEELMRTFPMQWEFTDKRPTEDSPHPGHTFYVPEGSSKKQILDAYRNSLNRAEVKPAQEPWQVSRSEWEKQIGKPYSALQHATSIENALKEGRPVPSEVLAEYPNLNPTVQKPLTVPKPVAEYTLLDAVNEHGGLGGPALDAAMKEMSTGTPASVIAARYGEQYNGLTDIFQTAFEAYKVRKNNANYNRFKKAYEVAGLGDGKKKIDTTHEAILQSVNKGNGFPGGAPSDQSDLIARAWQEAQDKVSGVKPKAETKKAMLEAADEAATTDARFQRDTTRKTKTTETLVPDDLKVGDSFVLNGAKLRVIDVSLDPDTGDLISITLDDGKKYGTQVIDGKRLLRMDVGSLESKPADFVPEEKPNLPQLGSPAAQKTATAKVEEPSAVANLPQKYQMIGKGPQTWTQLERLKATPIEIENGEQPIRIKNDRTGEIIIEPESKLKPVNARTAEEKAKSVKKTDDEQLIALGVNKAAVASMTKPEKVAYLQRMKKQGKFGTGQEGGGITVEAATKAIHDVLGTYGGLPQGIVVVRDESSPWGGRIDERNRITINAAQISSPARAQQVIIEEGLHGVWENPEVQRAWRDIRKAVSLVNIADERISREAQGLDTRPEVIREEAAIALLIARQTNRDLVTKLLDAIRTAIKKTFGLDLPGTSRQQLIDAATEFLTQRNKRGENGETSQFAQGDTGRFNRINRELNTLNEKETRTPVEERRVAELQRQLGQMDLPIESRREGSAERSKTENDATAMEIAARQNKRLVGADITTQGDLLEKKPIGQQSFFAESDVMPAETPDKRVYGQYDSVRNVGQEGNQENLERIRRNVRAVIFDSTQPATPELTQQAWELAGRLTASEGRAKLAGEMAEYGGGQSAPSLAVRELRNYALRLARGGDDSLLKMMANRSRDFGISSDVTVEATARAMRGLQGGPDDEVAGAFKALESVAKQMYEAAGKRLGVGQVKFDELMDAMNRMNLSEKDFMEILKTGKDSTGKTLEQIILDVSPERKAADDLIGEFSNRYAEIPRGTALQTVYEWMRREVAPTDEAAFVSSLRTRLESLFGSSKVNPEVAQMIAEQTWNRKINLVTEKTTRLLDAELRKIDNMAQAEAQRQMLRLESLDTEWTNATPQQVNEVREIVKAALKSDAPLYENDPTRFTRELADRLETAGVDRASAGTLADDIFTKRLNDWSAARRRATIAASKSNNIRSLIEDIRNSPQLAQSNPEWLRETAENWFKSNGLSAEQAKYAATEFQKEFNAAMVKAREKIAEQIVGRGDMKRLNDLLDAIRVGLTNPDQNWTEVLAKREGWKPFTQEQNQKLAQLELQANDPAMSPQEIADTYSQMMRIERSVGLDKSNRMQAMSERYMTGLLSSVRTFTIQFGPTIMTLRDFPIMALSDPKNAVAFATAMFRANKKVLTSEAKWAWQKKAYGFHLGDMDLKHNQLLRNWERAEEEYRIGNVAQKAAARAKQLWSIGHFVTHMLNTLDQAQMASVQAWKLPYYASIAFKEAGLTTSKIGDLVEAMAVQRQASFDRAMDAGLSADAASVRSNNEQVQFVRDFVANKTTSDLAKQVLRATENDTYATTGRKSSGVEEQDEGMLSRAGPNQLMTAISQYRAKGGWDSVMATAAFGFVNIPYRTLRYFSNFGPYGLLRVGVDKWRTNRRMDTLWKQSFGNTLNARARYREAVAGTILSLVATAWATKNNTSEDGAGDENFGLYITGNGPQSKVLRDAWTKKGWKPYALNFVIGGHIVPIPVTRIGEALMPPFILPASMDDVAWKVKAKEVAGNPVKNLPGTYASTLLGEAFYMSGQAGFLQTAAQLGQAFQGGQGTVKPAVKIIGGTVSASVLPLKQLLQSFSDMFVGPLDTSSISAVVANQFPIVGLIPSAFGDKYAVQHKSVNRFGDDLYDRSWYGRLYQTGIPIAFKVSPTPQNMELYPMLVDKGAAPPELRRYVLEDKYGELTNDQFGQFARISGTALKKSVVDNLPALKDMTPEGVSVFLERATHQADAQAASQLDLERQKPPARASGASGAILGVGTPSGGQSFNGGAGAASVGRKSSITGPSSRRSSVSGPAKIRINRLRTVRSTMPRSRRISLGRVRGPKKVRTRRMRLPRNLMA